MHPFPGDIICYHCQQAAEKYLKAFLVFNDQEPPKTHDLIELVKLCNIYENNFLLMSPRCEFLAPFATRTCYPGTNDPDNEDIKKAIKYTAEIIEFIKSKLPV